MPQIKDSTATVLGLVPTAVVVYTVPVLALAHVQAYVPACEAVVVDVAPPAS